MFENAIENILRYTRALHSVSRTYGGILLPGASTLFFVNDQGVAITCKHVAALIQAADTINKDFDRFKHEREKLPRNVHYKNALKKLESKHHYKTESTVQLKNNFMNCVDRFSDLTIHFHPTLDLAVIVFKGYDSLLYPAHAVFAGDDAPIKQGKYLCRIGFPFPEFNNFRYNEKTDDVEWTNSGIVASPSFPIDGIITRFIAQANTPTSITGIEMSTPGLRGQSGGPLFDQHGIIYGMQYATHHLHLGFDMKKHEIISEGTRNNVSNYPFLHVGQCIHVSAIKDFLRQHQIQFETA